MNRPFLRVHFTGSSITFNRNAFVSYENIQRSTVDLGADSKAMIVGQGDIVLQVHVNGKSKKCTLKDVKHVPSLRYQLLSVSVMARKGISSLFNNTGVTLTNGSNGQTLATCSILNGLYSLDRNSNRGDADAALLASIDLWHQRLGHVNVAGIKRMATRNIVNGIKIDSSESINSTCDGCQMGKGKRTKISQKVSTRAKGILDLEHSDVLGPMETASVGGSKYVVVFVDDFSNWTVLFAMTRKSETFNCFKQFKKLAETHTNRFLKNLNVCRHNYPLEYSPSEFKRLEAQRSDNGGEYLSTEFRE